MLGHTSFGSERAGGASHLPLLPSPELGIQLNDPASDQNEHSSDVLGGMIQTTIVLIALWTIMQKSSLLHH